MTPKEEAAYERGERAGLLRALQDVTAALGYTSKRGKEASLIAEREQAIAALRDICLVHGDNDWPANLHLADIIEKHLGRHLDEAAQKRGGKSR